MNRHALIIPTYNERQNIGLLVEEILKLGLDSQVIIVDGNSPDGTVELADELAAQYPGVRVIHRLGKLGIGTAMCAVPKAALEGEAASILTMDADFSHHPRYIPGLLAALEQFDVVIGSRYVPGGGTLNCSIPCKALTRGANLSASTALSLRAGTCGGGDGIPLPRCY